MHEPKSPDIIDTLDFNGSEYYETADYETTSFYSPSGPDVLQMASYVDPSECSGSDTGTMQVVFRVHFYRERKWHLDEFGNHLGVTPVWDYLTDETGSLPVIEDLAWRYI